MPNDIIKISPSNLSFLWDDCKGCFWEVTVNRNPRPSGPFPSIFNTLDLLQKKALMNLRSENITVDGLTIPLPKGELIVGDLRVQSTSILSIEGKDFVLAGKMDCGYQFEDATTGIVDYKTAKPKDDYFIKYGRQLNAYRHCLEHPYIGVPEKVSRLGLMYFTPSSFEVRDGGMSASCGFDVKWVDVDFLDMVESKFGKELASVLSFKTAPEHERMCQYKRHYR